jgi:transcriptional regulator with XRE-family HTH domain
MAKREISTEFYGRNTPLHSSRPLTEIEALMEAMPGEEPVESVMELQPLREAVAQCIDQLDDQDKWIIEALMSESLSLQQLAERMGITKTHVWRLRNKAYDKLHRIMITHPTIRKKVRVADTWGQAAGQWVNHFSTLSDKEEEANISLLMSLRDNAAIAIRMTVEPSTVVWNTIAKMAISELRLLGCWDTGRMIRTLCSKQNDYGHGNINKFGLMGVAVRLSDKIERLANLKEKGEEYYVANESFVDTLVDIVGYCAIAQMLNDETFNLELEKDWFEATSSLEGVIND